MWKLCLTSGAEGKSKKHKSCWLHCGKLLTGSRQATRSSRSTCLRPLIYEMASHGHPKMLGRHLGARLGPLAYRQAALHL
ncbi:hypothetical protein FKM82_026656 [Ascaphus truei]